MQVDRALQVRQQRGAQRLVRAREIAALMLAADAEAAFHAVVGTQVRAQDVADADVLEELQVDLALAPDARPQVLVDGHHAVRRQADEGIERVVVVVVGGLARQGRTTMLRGIDHEPAPVRGRRAQDQRDVVGVELPADLLQRLAPWHLFHRSLVDIAQQRAEVRQRHRRLREQVRGCLVVAHLHQHFLCLHCGVRSAPDVPDGWPSCGLCGPSFVPRL
ncbi:hypothetical protein D9M72_448000 [compost metagenome]